jgi:hypothetical protein
MMLTEFRRPGWGPAADRLLEDVCKGTAVHGGAVFGAANPGAAVTDDANFVEGAFAEEAVDCWERSAGTADIGLVLKRTVIGTAVDKDTFDKGAAVTGSAVAGAAVEGAKNLIKLSSGKIN